MKAGTFFIIIAAFSLSFLLSPLSASSSPEPGKYTAISAGKEALERGENTLAIEQLTAAIDAAPIIEDYLLLWRAEAYEKLEERDKALADLREIREKYPQSPLLREARKKELTVVSKAEEKLSKETAGLFSSYLRDYPSEVSLKFLYASLLKKGGEGAKAKPLFLEIYRSSSSLSSKAAKELSPSDISAKDILERAENLNKAWLFSSAEKSFREALDRLGRKSALAKKGFQGLAYALFRQKKYREAADLYKDLNLPYWRARSLLRADEREAFERELPSFLRTSDKRMAPVLIAYGTTKRRKGDREAAMAIFDSVIARFPSHREEALWAKGWTYYLTGKYDDASEIMARLYKATEDSRYLYWKERCREASDGAFPLHSKAAAVSYRDFYGYLFILKNPAPFKTEELKGTDLPVQAAIEDLSERAAILAEAGLRKEAAAELLRLTRNTADAEKLVLISSALRSLGNYKQSIRTASKMPYAEELHELFYPRAFPSDVAEAARRSGLDPFLILSVIREESRFDPEARSIAGAMGLMQLMPQTARRVAKGLPDVSPEDLTSPQANISIGAQYLRHLVDTFSSLPLAIAAYNAGERAVNNWLRKGSYSTVDEFIEDIPYDETRNYVKKVMTSYFEYMKWRGFEGLSSSQITMGNL